MWGGGAKGAAQRRIQEGREEEARRRVEGAHFAAHIRGRGRREAGEVYV